MKIDKAELKGNILMELRRQYGKTLEEAHEFELYNAISKVALDYAMENGTILKRLMLKNR